MKRITLVLLAAMAVFSAAACGGGSENGSTITGPTASPAPAASPAATPTPSAALARYCQESLEPLPSFNVQVTARWKGKDRIVIEGSADLPGPGKVNYWVCQDGELTASLVRARQPTFEDGKISAESKLVEPRVGPVFDPDAHFEVFLEILGDPIQVPFFIISVPVEGKPD
jgi:hypothetical protein